MKTEHGNTILRTVPCGVHPLHLVKVRASGARSGCPMCEMRVEDLCRVSSTARQSPSSHQSTARTHAPRVDADHTRIIGCACGWRTPHEATDSDDAFAAHVAINDIHRKVERVPMTKSAFNGVQVFSATMVAQRQVLGETVTRWIEEAKKTRPGFQLVDVVVSQSSDDEFHCLAICIFFRDDAQIQRRRPT